jgi:hypothetical protein
MNPEGLLHFDDERNVGKAVPSVHVRGGRRVRKGQGLVFEILLKDRVQAIID